MEGVERPTYPVIDGAGRSILPPFMWNDLSDHESVGYVDVEFTASAVDLTKSVSKPHTSGSHALNVEDLWLGRLWLGGIGSWWESKPSGLQST